MAPEFARAEVVRLEARIADEEERLARARAQRPTAQSRRFIRHRMGDLVLLRSGLRRAWSEVQIAWTEFSDD